MRQIQPDLWETTVERPLPGLTTHAYLLTHETGNVLFYNTGLAGEIEQLAALGGVARHYLSHRDELGESINTIRDRYGALLGGHAREQEEFARIRRPDILFERREVHVDRIEVIPTPGHTPGSTCFFVRSADGRSYLFTGDTLWLAGGGRWKAGYLSGISDRGALRASLLTLRELRPDLVVSSAFAGETGFMEMSPDAWPGHVEQALAQLI